MVSRARRFVGWLAFAAGQAVGYAVKLLPTVLLYTAAGMAITFALQAVFGIHTRIVEGIALAITLRMLGMLWRGDANPIERKMKGRNFYE